MSETKEKITRQEYLALKNSDDAFENALAVKAKSDGLIEEGDER